MTEKNAFPFSQILFTVFAVSPISFNTKVVMDGRSLIFCGDDILQLFSALFIFLAEPPEEFLQ